MTERAAITGVERAAGTERVLITGASGFVGSALALGLARLGFQPVLHDLTFEDTAFDDAALDDRIFDAEAARLLEPFERLTGDLRALQADLGGGLNADYLIHGAAITADPASCGLSEAQHLSRNVALGLAALELAEACRVRRAVLISSAGVFSPSCAAPLDEDARPNALGAYAAAKRMLELAVESLRARGVLDVASVRLGNLYGPLERARASRPRLSLVARMAQEARREWRIIVETPEAERDWTLVEDLPGAFTALLRHPELPAGVLHLANPEAVTDERLARSVAAGLELELGPVPLVLSRGRQSPVRPPLQSRHAAALGLPAWTSLADGLARTLGAPRAVVA